MRYFKTIMHKAFTAHALANARCFEKTRRSSFENAGSNAPQNVISVNTVQDDSIDASVVQQLPQQQA